MTDTFWVIERFENGQSRGYWFGNSSREFSTDIDIAIQFHRKQDAQAIRRAWHWKDCEVTEHSYTDSAVNSHAALQQANERMRRALDGLVASAITCCPEYLSLVANGKRGNETIQGWALGDWKKLNAALDIARAALAEAGREMGI